VTCNWPPPPWPLAHGATQPLPTPVEHATRSRAPDARRKARHEAGYRSRLCLKA
jgi:hypothetical protein